MDYCNGKTHHWSDDSYSHGSYPCPGWPKCTSEAAKRQMEDDVSDALTDTRSNPDPRGRLITLPPAHSNVKVNIKVSIPIKLRGPFGQRDEYMTFNREAQVEVEDGNVTLTEGDREMTFSKTDFDAALRALNYNPGPVMRGGPRVEQ